MSTSMTGWRRRPRALAVAAVLALAAGAAQATDLLEVWQAARDHDPALAAARAGLDAGAARAEQAKSLWRPTVVLEAAVAYGTTETSTRDAHFSAPGFGATNGVAFDTSVSGGIAGSTRLAVRQPLWNRSLDAQARQLEVASDAAGRQWSAAQQSLALRSVQAYFEAALAGERLRLVDRQQQSVERALQEAKDRFRIGDRPVTEVHEASARAAALQAERIAAHNDRTLARARLVDLTGLAALSAPDGADGVLPLPSRTPDGAIAPLDDWIVRAERAHPQLQLARTHLEAAEARALATRAALSPSVDLVAQMGRERMAGNGDYGGHARQRQRQDAIGVQLAVPLYTGGLRSAQQAEAQAGIEQARAEVEAARLAVTQEARAAWLDVSAGAARVRSLEASLDASRARLDATQVGVRAGHRTTLDLLNAENDAAAAELALQQARSGLVAARLRLAAAAGELDEAAIRQANAQLHSPPGH